MWRPSPVTTSASSTLWHQGQAFPTYRWYRPDSTCVMVSHGQADGGWWRCDAWGGDG